MSDVNASQESSKTEGNIIYLWKLPIDKDFVKSIPSILRVVASLLSLIAFICVASGRSENCDDDYASTYNYFEFVSISTFLTLIIMWFFFTFTLTTRLFFKIVPWDFGYLIIEAVIIVLYLIANCCLAAQDCGKDSNRAGAAFGFFALFCVIIDAILLFRKWKANRQESRDSASKSQDYEADRNIEQY